VTAVDIFSDTIAEMTWYEVEEAARTGAVLLWPIGVIEQHGPHLPAGTDVYIPTARARRVKEALARRGVQALVVPAYYWGINVVSGSFPASYGIRPELMREVLADLLAAFSRDGFQQLYCLSGHGDALHNRTIYEAIAQGVERSGIDASFVMDRALAQRLGLELDDPLLTLHGDSHPDLVQGSSPSAPRDAGSPGEFIDVHAGRWETSIVMHTCPELVREERRRDLVPTDYGAADLAVWRRGFDEARAKTPLGYFGDPASASEAEGVGSLEQSTDEAVEAILARIGPGSGREPRLPATR
jgi:creatinine amidohydrolase